jgi:hypothetical protein
LVFGGPDPLSWSEIVAKAAEILGAPIPVRAVQPGEPIASLPPPLDQVAGGMAAGLEQQDVIIDSTEALRLLGVTLTPVEAVLRRALLKAA